MLNEKYPKSDGDVWETEDIDEIRENNKKISKKLKNLVWNKCSMRVGKPKLAYDIAMSIQNKENLSENLKHIMEKLYDIGNEFW